MTHRRRGRHALAAAVAVALLATHGGEAAERVTRDAAASSAAAERAAGLRVPVLRVPVAGVARTELRDSYAEQRGAQRHEAIDIPAPRGTPVVAVAQGRIAKLFHSAAGGLTVYQFSADGTLAYYYAHLDRYAANLREGASVQPGDVLGYVGTTGNTPPGAPHLHFAIFRLGPERAWWKGSPVNPYPRLTGAPP